MSKPTVVIFDIDGTISDTAHRSHFLTGPKKDWDAFYAAMADDATRGPVVDLLRAVAHVFPVILCTGRPSNYRDVTIKWLNAHAIPFRELYMRAEGDHRDDTIVKREMLQTIRVVFEPIFVVDDRSKVVAMWRSEGLVCFQCASGDF